MVVHPYHSALFLCTQRVQFHWTDERGEVLFPDKSRNAEMPIESPCTCAYCNRTGHLCFSSRRSNNKKSSGSTRKYHRTFGVSEDANGNVRGRENGSSSLYYARLGSRGCLAEERITHSTRISNIKGLGTESRACQQRLGLLEISRFELTEEGDRPP